MNRQHRRQMLRLWGVKDLRGTNKAKLAALKAVWDKYFPNGDRQLSDGEFKQAQNELNKILGDKHRK